MDERMMRIRNKHQKTFKELSEITAKLFPLLVAVIAFKSADAGKELFKTHPFVMDAIVLMLLLYFFLLILVTVLQLPVENFLPNLIILGFASVASTLACRLVSSTLTWITLALWVFIFITKVCYNYEEVRELIHNEVVEKTKRLMERLQIGFRIAERIESNEPANGRLPI